ncbi:MAG: Uma2 family endonuclease, partial [Caldilineaceae bacterium]|nr:Uma2 family endonuclease [Caldilineaceae bacterium]
MATAESRPDAARCGRHPDDCHRRSRVSRCGRCCSFRQRPCQSAGQAATWHPGRGTDWRTARRRQPSIAIDSRWQASTHGGSAVAPSRQRAKPATTTRCDAWRNSFRVFSTPAFGIPEYWIVDPQTATITVLRLEDARYVE